MFQKIIKVIGGDPHKREVEKFAVIVEQINSLESTFEALSEDELREKTVEFRRRLNDGEESLDDILPEAFAAVREASKRTIGLRHYDVQMIGGIALHNSRIAEMRTGEGKTLVATLPLYLNALTARGVHLVTVNDYLARRDARWMAPIYYALGMSVGVLQMAARTENGRNAFLVDLEKTSPHEDQHQLKVVLRNEAYQADITYGTNNEFGFDYLRDNLTMRLEDRSQRGHYYAIVDEVDNILIDEARTPLIISGPAQDDTEWYIKMAVVVRQLNPEDYEINEKDRSVSLTEIGEIHVEEILQTVDKDSANLTLRDPDRPEDITPEQARLMGYLEQALRAQFLFKRNKDYLVQGGKVVIVDEFTGRLMPGRRWSDGLHQSVEAKEGVKVEAENVTYATITLQNYFRMYEKLAGMTGTALTEAEEFYKIYKLDVLPIPTNLEYQAFAANAPLIEVENKDEEGYKQTYYTRRDDPLKLPIYWRRKDYPDVVYRTEEAKLRAIIMEIIKDHIKGQPVLVGTTSVEHSDRLSDRLSAEPIRRFMQTVLIRQAWLDKNKREQDERAIPELDFLYQPLPQLQPGDLRPLAKSLDLSLNPEDASNLDMLLKALGLSEEDRPRLLGILQAGVPHQVLNARKHDEESQIITRAGAFGAVTIATNMAGRGVDIKLGGELPEEILGDVNRVLNRAGQDPYDMTNEQRRQALLKIPAEEYGIYDEQVHEFLKYFDDMERVRALGGLHVIGSERHEARRIDNQLRGRAARQGDPGSSRFYLSLDDELMRLFGGGNVEGLLKRLNIDESMPIESGMVGRLVEQSQERVEGSNFDIRKHLLEYDDVLNSQRKRIYSQRDRVFTKEDLSEDVLDMLHSELEGRIPSGLKDEEGPWKLLALLEQIQPPLEYEDISYPSFTFRLLIDEVRNALQEGSGNKKENLRASLMDLAQDAFEAEKEHLMMNLHTLLQNTEESLQAQRQEKMEALDTFLEGLSLMDEDGGQRKPQEILDDLTATVGLPLKVSQQQLRQLGEANGDLQDSLGQQIDQYLLALTTSRLMGSLKRRLPEVGEVRLSQLPGTTYTEIADYFLRLTETTFEQRRQKLFGDAGQISHDLDPLIERMGEEEVGDNDLVKLLTSITVGSRLMFDPKTHRQVRQRTNRLSYIYLASRLIGDNTPQNITEDVLDHLEGAIEALQRALGRAEFNRLMLNQVFLSQLESRLKDQAVEAFGLEKFNELSARPLLEFTPEERDMIADILGTRLQTEIYRHILLTVISELWVEYLTKVEALRVSIGLEAYAQRDPLVQYKSKASEMFKELLADIRMGVVSRMFTYQPRKVTTTAPESPENGPEEPQEKNTLDKSTQSSSKKKRRRH
jgi:preprotein translocase subunit SecA